MVSLPADDAAHPREPWEWWYWTGHLRAADERWFGFELVFFRVFERRWPFHVVHHAITDISARTFHHVVARQPRTGFPVTNGFDLRCAPFHAHGGDGEDVLHGEMDGWSLDLALHSEKPPALHHRGEGFIKYPVGGYSAYYSRTRQRAEGTIRRGDEVIEVTGQTWFDHQWGELGRVSTQGWDWFALQLDDGREIMLFMLGDLGKRALIGGSLVDVDGRCTEIEPEDCRIVPLRTWKSPATGGSYPMGWTLDVAGMHLVVEPVLDDQEVRAPTFNYWEGAATVRGAATGRAYIELTSYAG